MAISEEPKTVDRGAFHLETVSGSISPEIAGKVVRLLHLVWPASDSGGDFSISAQGLFDWVRDDPSLQILLAWDGNGLVGHARLFQRVVKCEDFQLPLLGLAGVCSHPRCRGRGVGRLLIERAFEEVQLSHFPICLLQTTIPDFYSKLGAKVVENTFINRTKRKDPDANPWWETHVMIYPDFPGWPTGVINLNGPGF